MKKVIKIYSEKQFKKTAPCGLAFFFVMGFPREWKTKLRRIIVACLGCFLEFLAPKEWRKKGFKLPFIFFSLSSWHLISEQSNSVRD